MLPLLQRHPQMVPEASNVDSAACLPNNDDHAGDQHLRSVVSHQRSFPIRASRPQVTGVNTSYPSPYEHHLRRKTPNGTIDAGYDGTPTRLLPGPPPQKHMILPGDNEAISYNTAGSFAHSLRHTGANVYSATQEAPWSRTPPFTDLSFANSQPVYHNRPAGSHLVYPSYFPDAYQPVMRAHEYNVRAFCPPPVPVHDGPALQQMGFWQFHNPGIGPAAHRNTGLQESDFRHPVPVQLDSTPMGSLGASSGIPLSDEGHSQLESAALLSNVDRGFSIGAREQTGVTQHQFRDRALSRAHKSYIDLLAYVHAARRFHHGKTNPVSHSSSRLIIYPKPPKLVRPTSLSLLHPESSSSNDGNWTRHSRTTHGVSGPFGHHGHHENPPELQKLNGGQLSHHPSLHYGVASNSHLSRRNNLDVFDQHRMFSPGSITATSPQSTDKSAPFRKATPLANAKESLELLKNLCEQSRWKWTDGVMLGGCLHYGLEHYEDALQWFSRVMTLDSSHVEAITNVAATLFCLNRQDEAEQYWLKAIKLRPDYLEATEHLVGLLYKKRSKEAVEVISYVQRALKLTQPLSAHKQKGITHGSTNTGDMGSTRHTSDALRPAMPLNLHPRLDNRRESREADDFGSSGYALPANENGRILALVHAKGTMLYSLKDIAQASEAFEEAVLISVGCRVSDIEDLVRRIQFALSPAELLPSSSGQSYLPLRPLLLPPEKARHTAHRLFPGTGELPGLVHVADGPPKRAAIQTTSNSLLSLAKIFQDAMSSGVSDVCLLRQPSGVGEILALYYLSLSLQESPSTANNVGILLAGVQQSVATGPNAMHTNNQPAIPGVQPGSGLALALAYYHYGLRLDPKHVHLHTNLGSLLKDIGQLDLAIQMYERAVACDGTFDIALTNLANAVKDRGRISDAIQYYRRAIETNPDFAEAVCGLLTALNSVCDWRGRGGVMLDAGKYDRWHVDGEGMLLDARIQRRGTGLTDRVVSIVGQQLGEATRWGHEVLQEQYRQALVQQLQQFGSRTHFDLDTRLSEWFGQPWEGSRILRLIERATRKIQRVWYHDKYVLSTQSTASKYRRPLIPPDLTVPSAPTVLPFHTFTSPLRAQDIRAISQRNAMRISCSTLRSPWLSPAVYVPPPPPRPHLNIGYVSSDFNNHPLAHLMQSVFGFHNTNRARAICYATTPSDRSTHRIKIEREAPVFHDATNWPAEKLVEQIISDEVHILVNLNGYTRGARNEVFAARPAPIQMSFMGFAGTLGAEWCDYILADSTAIPSSTLRPWRNNVDIEDIFDDANEGSGGDWVYSENVIFCRGSFFCCDHAQSCDANERGLTWADEGRRRWEMRKQLFPSLADDTVILGNFNQLYKIDPTTFRTWLRILARVPKAVLWLLRFPELGETNLRRTAETWAGAEVASRLIFTDVAPKSLHIARARVCDLFLDTPECNAHTTAADVLWSSTPLLTLPRYPYKMCSRMAASILRGALPKTPEGHQAAGELIVENELDYEESAIRLAGGLVYKVKEGSCGEGQGRLSEMRQLLWQNRWQCALFDTRRWVSDLETAYEEAWRRWLAGEGGDIYL